MPTYVTSASTLAQVHAAVDDNADYDVAADTDKAKQFIVACRLWLRRHPTEAGGVSHRLREEAPRIQKELEKAEAWLARNETTSTVQARGKVRYFDISGGFR